MGTMFGTTAGTRPTSGNSHAFGIGWAELIPGAPPLSVQYSRRHVLLDFGTDQEDQESRKISTVQQLQARWLELERASTDTRTIP